MQQPDEPLHEQADLESFEAHDRSLRRLAHHLVGGLDSDDLVQETWLAAVETGWKRALQQPTWLRGVLRKKALMSKRGGGRRRQREELFLREVSALSEDPALEQREIGENLLQALERLREPEHSVVRLRYLEGLTLSAIADRLGRPEDTIKGQLRRGLAMLREDWERKHGSERGRSSLAGLAFGRSVRGELARNSASPALLGWVGAALCLSSLIWWVALGGAGRAGGPMPPVQASDTEHALASGASVGRGLGPPAASEAPTREAAPGASPSDTDEDLSARSGSGGVWQVLVLDPDGHPLEGAEVYVNGDTHRATSAADGIARLSVAPGETNRLGVGLLEGRTTFYAEHPAYLRSGDYYVSPDAEGGGELRLSFEHELEWVRGSVRTRTGEPLAGARIGLYDEPGSFVRLEDGVVRVSHEERVRSGSDGSFRLRGRNAQGYVLRVECDGHAPSVARVLDLPSGPEGLLVRLDPGARISGRVLDEQGAPVPSAILRYASQAGTVHHESVADAEGFFDVSELGLGSLTLWALDPRDAQLYTSIRLEARYGEPLEWNPVLGYHAPWRMRLIDREGRPLEGYLCQLALEDWLLSEPTDQDGWTRPIRLYPDEPTAVLVHDPDHPMSMPLYFRDEQRLDGSDLELRLEREPEDLVPLRGRILDVQGAPPQGAFALALFDAKGRLSMSFFDLDRSTGAFRAGPQPPGEYELLLGLEGAGVHAFPPFELVPGDELDLGDLRLPAPGRLVLLVDGYEEGGRPERFSLEYVRQLGARQTYLYAGELPPSPEGAAGELLPGEYRVHAWRELRETGLRSALVQSGRETRIDFRDELK